MTSIVTNAAGKAGGLILRVGLIPILGHRFPDAAASADTAKIIVPRRSTKAHTATRRSRKSVAITSSLQMIGKGAILVVEIHKIFLSTKIPGGMVLTDTL